jgi:protein involved in polysaccharide export with SLBB domain
MNRTSFIFKIFLLISFACFLLPDISQSQVTSTYPFKPGDGLQINTFPDTTSFLHRTFPIDDQGYIELPLEGKVKVSQMKIEDLQTFIREKFKAYLRTPNVVVKPMIRVTMLGGFIRPGLYYADVNSSLWEVIRMGGGTTTEDGIYELKWERDKDEQKDVFSYFERGVSLRQMGFRSGDQLYTPSETRTFWETFGNVTAVVGFGMSIYMLYYSYQRDIYLYQSRR